MVATGILLAYERQINSWAGAPNISVTDPSAPPMALNAVIAKLIRFGHGVPDQLVLHHDELNRVDARYDCEQILFLNCQTGAVAGAASRRAWAAGFGLQESRGCWLSREVSLGTSGKKSCYELKEMSTFRRYPAPRSCRHLNPVDLHLRSRAAP